MRLILASASPRRLDLLRAVGLEPEVIPAGVEETPIAGETPRQAAVRLAGDKVRAVAARVDGAAIVIAADTVVEADGRALGKPRDVEENRSMLASLSGRVHVVHTALGVVAPAARREALAATSTEVAFATLTEAEIAWYVESGEGLDKAGGYAIQGRASAFVREIRGSYTNVVGLPVFQLRQLLGSLGYDLIPGAG